MKRNERNLHLICMMLLASSVNLLGIKGDAQETTTTSKKTSASDKSTSTQILNAIKSAPSNAFNAVSTGLAKATGYQHIDTTPGAAPGAKTGWTFDNTQTAKSLAKVMNYQSDLANPVDYNVNLNPVRSAAQKVGLSNGPIEFKTGETGVNFNPVRRTVGLAEKTPTYWNAKSVADKYQNNRLLQQHQKDPNTTIEKLDANKTGTITSMDANGKQTITYQVKGTSVATEDVASGNITNANGQKITALLVNPILDSNIQAAKTAASASTTLGVLKNANGDTINLITDPQFVKDNISNITIKNLDGSDTGTVTTTDANGNQTITYQVKGTSVATETVPAPKKGIKTFNTIISTDGSTPASNDANIKSAKDAAKKATSLLELKNSDKTTTLYAAPETSGQAIYNASGALYTSGTGRKGDLLRTNIANSSLAAGKLAMSVPSAALSGLRDTGRVLVGGVGADLGINAANATYAGVKGVFYDAPKAIGTGVSNVILASPKSTYKAIKNKTSDTSTTPTNVQASSAAVVPGTPDSSASGSGSVSSELASPLSRKNSVGDLMSEPTPGATSTASANPAPKGSYFSFSNPFRSKPAPVDSSNAVQPSDISANPSSDVTSTDAGQIVAQDTSLGWNGSVSDVANATKKALGQNIPATSTSTNTSTPIDLASTATAPNTPAQTPEQLKRLQDVVNMDKGFNKATRQAKQTSNAAINVTSITTSDASTPTSPTSVVSNADLPANGKTPDTTQNQNSSNAPTVSLADLGLNW